MKKGFTIIELLVASALMGLLVTILSMFFNQSSIAWRVGTSGVKEMGDIRYGVGAVREVADNFFFVGSDSHRILSIWDSQGKRSRFFRTRACDAESSVDSKVNPQTLTRKFQNYAGLGESTKPSSFQPFDVRGNDDSSANNGYIVNVKSCGPDRKLETRYDNIVSYPYELH